MSAVEDLIYQYEVPQREVLLFLHRLLIDELNLIPKIKPLNLSFNKLSYTLYTITGKLKLSLSCGLVTRIMNELVLIAGERNRCTRVRGELS